MIFKNNLLGHNSRIFTLATNNQIVLSGGWEKNTILVWSAKKPEFLGRLVNGHNDSVNDLIFAKLNNKNVMLSASSDRLFYKFYSFYFILY